MNSIRPTLREILEEVFSRPAEFEAFFGDYFPSARRLCTTGMDRTQQITLLLERFAAHQVLSALVRNFKDKPQLLQMIEQRISNTSSVDAPEENVVNQQILDLSQEIALRRNKNVPIDFLLPKLRELKKKRRGMREGPGLSPGHILGERYRLVTLIGKGGFAMVWLAFDYQIKTLVAIKVLHNEHASSSHQVERFQRAARTLQVLSHPHIVRLLDGPKVDEGYHYIVLEYALGGDLEDAITKQRISVGAGLRIVLQTGRGLAFAHQQSYFHRDVKPQNILISTDGTARLADFDLVHAEDSTGGTRTGALGTFFYAAPEQLEDGSRVDARADIYSLGMTAIFVLHGRRLPQTVLDHSGRQALIASLDCPRPIRDVLRRAVNSDPAKRYKSMSDFCTEFERRLQLILAPEPLAPKGHRPRRSDWYIGAALGIIVGGLSSYLIYHHQTKPVAVSATTSQDLSTFTHVTVTPTLVEPLATSLQPRADLGSTNREPGALVRKNLSSRKEPARNGEANAPRSNTPKPGSDPAHPTQSVPLPPVALRESLPAPATPRDMAVQQTEGTSSQKTPDELMKDAQAAYVRGERGLATELALLVAEQDGPDAERAWRFIGSAACANHNALMVNKAYNKLTSSEHKQMLQELCMRNGLPFEDGHFRHSLSK